MKTSRLDGTTTITLDDRELRLMRAALQRATFMDTPPEQQEAILEFAAKALDQLERLPTTKG